MFCVLNKHSTGLAAIGWRYFIVFGALNISFVPIIWYFYVETANLSLEEIDLMFEIHSTHNKKISFEEAARKAKLETERIKQEVARDAGKDSGKAHLGETELVVK